MKNVDPSNQYEISEKDRKTGFESYGKKISALFGNFIKTILIKKKTYSQ